MGTIERRDFERVEIRVGRKTRSGVSSSAWSTFRPSRLARCCQSARSPGSKTRTARRCRACRTRRCPREPVLSSPYPSPPHDDARGAADARAGGAGVGHAPPRPKPPSSAGGQRDSLPRRFRMCESNLAGAAVGAADAVTNPSRWRRNASPVPAPASACRRRSGPRRTERRGWRPASGGPSARRRSPGRSPAWPARAEPRGSARRPAGRTPSSVSDPPRRARTPVCCPRPGSVRAR